jgi:type IV secretion system protein TrbL
MAYGLGAAASGESGLAGVAAGMGGIGRAGAGAAANAIRGVGRRIADSFSESITAGRDAAWRATGGGPAADNASVATAPQTAAASDAAPEWARRLRAEQMRRAHLHSTAQAVKEGDRQMGEAHPDLDQRED